MLSDKSVLIVEDEFLIGQMLEDMLAESGCTRISVAISVPLALEALNNDKPDLVILDLNLDGQSVMPIAEKLREKQIPFVISSGYGPDILDGEWKKYPLVEKPYLADALQAKIAQALAMAAS